MKKLIIILVVVVLILVVASLVGGGEAAYVSEINDEIDQLENELEEIEELVESGDLTESEAVNAYNRITARLVAIDSQVVAADADVTLTAEQRQELQSTLERLRTMLVDYSGVLTDVESVVPQNQRNVNTGNRGTPFPGSAVLYFRDIVETFEEHVEDVVDEETPNEDESDDESDDNATSTDDESATSSDDMDDDEGATSTDEESVDGETGTSTNEV